VLLKKSIYISIFTNKLNTFFIKQKKRGGYKMSKLIIKTSLGDIELELFDNEAPETVKNFLSYVDDRHYDNTIFHRVISKFMIQGGGFDTSFTQLPTKSPVKNEATNGLKNTLGTVAMARTSDIDSATSQFFINVNDNDFLNHTAPTQAGYGYCVFGKVTDGMDVVEEIEKVATGQKGPHGDVPLENVVIKEIVRS
jgi:cyclophilin family peptidyl-prolyl cis-trans isomerase